MGAPLNGGPLGSGDNENVNNENKAVNGLATGGGPLALVRWLAVCYRSFVRLKTGGVGLIGWR